MFPRIANSRGFGVGGPPAAHQLKAVRLAVQIETANNTNAKAHRAVEALIQIPLAAQTILPLTFAHGPNDEGKGLYSSLSGAGHVCHSRVLRGPERQAMHAQLAGQTRMAANNVSH
jgi:hypothetical protein